MVRRRVRVAEQRDVRVGARAAVREPHALCRGHQLRARRPDADDASRRAPMLSTSEVKPSSQWPGPPAIVRSVGGRWSRSGRSSRARGAGLQSGCVARRRRGRRRRSGCCGRRRRLAVGAPRRLAFPRRRRCRRRRSLRPARRRAARRASRRVARRCREAAVAAVPPQREDLAVAVEGESLAVRRPGRVRARARAGARRAPSARTVQTAPPRRTRGACRSATTPACRRRARAAPLCVPSASATHRSPRDERDPRAVGAPGGCVADRQNAVGADVDAREGEGESRDAVHELGGRLVERQHRARRRCPYPRAASASQRACASGTAPRARAARARRRGRRGRGGPRGRRGYARTSARAPRRSDAGRRRSRRSGSTRHRR